MSDLPKRAAVYCRISSDPTHQALGVARQEEDCRKRAAELGWTVGESYVDNDVSAYKGKRRPRYEAMLEDLEAGVVDGVIAWHADRLYRRMGDLLLFIDIIEKVGAPVQTVTSGDLDLTSGDGRLVAKIVAATAEHESDRKRERARRKHEELARAGKGSGGGTRPFGFEEDRVTLRQEEAELVRTASARILAGGTIRGLCREWNEQGISTVRGGRWTPAVLKRILTSARIAGWREYKGEMVAEAEWAAIVSLAELEGLRRILDDPARLTRKSSRKYLLTGGLAKCGLCGANLVARPKSDRQPCYVCASDQGGCGKIRCLAEPLEGAVEEMVRRALDGPELWRAIDQAGEDGGEGELLKEIHADKARLVELAEDYYVHEALTKPAFFNAREKLEKRLAGNEAELGQRAGNRALEAVQRRTGDLAPLWEELTLDSRRALVAAVLDHVAVGPAIKGQNFFNPARLAPVWRFGTTSVPA